MIKGIPYSVRRKGVFHWEWRAFLPDGRVAQGRRLSARAAKRAAVISALACRPDGAPVAPEDRDPPCVTVEGGAPPARVRQ
jgi:hypothetical protein